MYKYIFFSILLFTIGCTDTLGDFDNEMITVKLYTGVKSEISPTNGVDAVTRATKPLSPEEVNLIYDIWVVQYASDGVIFSDVTKQYRIGEPGEMAIPEGLEVTLRKSKNTTICLLANVGDTINKLIPNWPLDNLSQFNKTKIEMDIISRENNLTSFDGNVGLLKEVYMFGYFQGDITDETTMLSVTLGRLAVRLNLYIHNNTGKNFENVSINLKNVPQRMLISSMNIHGLDDEDYTDYTEYIRKVDNGTVAERYYFFGGGYNPDKEHITTLELNAKDSKTISFRLGGDPSVPDEFRDYSMYRNSVYTYTINLLPESQNPNP